MNFVKKVLDYLRILLSIKVIKLLVIPILLIFLWLSLSLAFSSYRSFTVLQYSHEVEKTNTKEFKLLKGKRISERFKANENNLGIIALRIGDVPIGDYEKEDNIVFRIKESGKDDWLFENKYSTGSFTSNQFFTFGFPIIEYSKDRIYEYEIFSLKGVANNSIEIKVNNSNNLSKYKFSKNEIFNSVGSFNNFMKKKMITFFTNKEVLFSSIGFLLPFIFYFIWVMYPNRKNIFPVLVGLLITSDIFLYDFFIPAYTLVLLMLWILVVYNWRIKSEVSYRFFISLVILSIISIYFDLNLNVDKISSYAYFLLVLGFIQTLNDHRTTSKR